MKPTIALLLAALTFSVAAPSSAKNPVREGLAQVRTVYLLPMANGMDQYLANRLTNSGVFQVVTDPKRADAIVTDRLGESFESREAEWFPEPAAVKAPNSAQAVAPAKQEQAEAPDAPAGDKPAAETPKPAAEEKQPDKPASLDLQGDRTAVPAPSFSRAKGTIFLVDPRTRLVLWSVYARPKDASAVEMDRTAGRIADRIKADLKPR